MLKIIFHYSTKNFTEIKIKMYTEYKKIYTSVICLKMRTDVFWHVLHHTTMMKTIDCDLSVTFNCPHVVWVMTVFTAEVFCCYSLTKAPSLLWETWGDCFIINCLTLVHAPSLLLTFPVWIPSTELKIHFVWDFQMCSV